MPRQSRIDTLGTLHFIMARGIEGGKIFRNDVDRESMSSLAEILGISLPSVSDSVKRGQMIAEGKGFKLLNHLQPNNLTESLFTSASPYELAIFTSPEAPTTS